MVKFDNCKDCKGPCEHAGKDRRFVCPGGVSCKVIHSDEQNKKLAQDFMAALRDLTVRPDAMDNLESYLERHFSVWFNKYCKTPEGLIHELTSFANIT